MTLLELMLVVALMGILALIALPRTRSQLDRIAVRGAITDAAALFERGRTLALARWTRATISIDTTRALVVLTTGGDTVSRQDAEAAHGVRLRASRSGTVYTPLGMAVGVANLTLIATRGGAAETLTVSRLGRVRR